MSSVLYLCGNLLKFIVPLSFFGRGKTEHNIVSAALLILSCILTIFLHSSSIHLLSSPSFHLSSLCVSFHLHPSLFIFHPLHSHHGSTTTTCCYSQFISYSVCTMAGWAAAYRSLARWMTTDITSQQHTNNHTHTHTHAQAETLESTSDFLKNPSKKNITCSISKIQNVESEVMPYRQPGA